MMNIYEEMYHQFLDMNNTSENFKIGLEEILILFTIYVQRCPSDSPTHCVVFLLCFSSSCVPCYQFLWIVHFLIPFPGADPGFQVREGANLKKMRRTEGGANKFGVFRVKNHDLMPKNHIFSNFRGGGTPTPLDPPLLSVFFNVYYIYNDVSHDIVSCSVTS